MRTLALALTALSILVLSACGDSGSGGAASGLVPEGAAVYGTVTLDPQGEQESAVRDIAGRFPDGDQLDEQIEKGLTETFREDGLNYAEDVKPWLGDEAAFFVSRVRENDADAAVIVETTDEDATREAFQKSGAGKAKERSHKGTDYLLEDETAYGVVDGRAVLGTEAGFKAAVDTGDSGASIEDAERVEEALDRLPDEALASVYFDGRKLLSSLGPEGALFAPFVSAFNEPYVVGVSAESDAVVVDSTVPAALAGLAAPLFLGTGTGAVKDLPADSFFAAGQPEVGKSIGQLVRLFASAAGGQQQVEAQVRQATGLDLNDDILAWMGDLGAFASGTSLEELRAGAVIETKDPGASRRALEVLGRLARREVDPGTTVSALSLPGGGDGFTLESPEVPQPVHVAQRGERVAIALGDESAEALLEPTDTLGEDPGFTDASGRLGEGFEASNYLVFVPILELAENEGAAQDEGYQEAKPYLEPLARLVAGTRKDGDVALSRTRVEFR
jgi:hypothetical protein